MFDETPRLFSVADILRKRKNKDDDYEFEDFPNIGEQHTTGTYDSNFDALGSEFERAHTFDYKNVKQPENTESDIDFSDYYDRLLKYEPSSYIKLEEDEIIPFSTDNDKPNEYYIDNLKGKTFDDLVISKMKEDAGAEDLPRDAMRRKFADDLLKQELPSFSSLEFNIPEEELQEQRKSAKKAILKNVNAKNRNPEVIIEAPISSSVKNPIARSPRSRKIHPPASRASDRLQNISAPVLGFSPEVRGKVETSKNNKKEAEDFFANPPPDNANNAQTPPLTEDEIIQSSPLAQNILSYNRKKANEVKEANAVVQKRGLQKFRENVARNNPTYEEMEQDGRNEKAMNNLKLKQAFGGFRTNIDRNKLKRESILTPEKSAATEAATYMGGGKSEYDHQGKEIPAKRGLHPNTSTGLEKSAQEKLEKRFPLVQQYKDSYSKLPKDQIVPKDIIKQYNKDVSPKVHIKVGAPVSVEDFLKFIEVDYERRLPKDQQPKLTPQSLQKHNSTVTPDPKKKKSSTTPLGVAMGMMGGI